MQLDPRASAAGARLIAHEVLVSTNAEALALAAQGERGPLWVTAARQTGGRGRRGRTWVSEPGNLFASLLLTDAAPPEHWPELAFVAALAIHDAVAEAAPGLSHPDGTDYPATDLAAAGADVSAETLFAILSAKMLGRLAQWHAGEHFSTIRADWLARAAGRGETIRLRLEEQDVIGRFDDVDESGRLLLSLPDGGRKTIATGDVVLGPVPGVSSHAGER
jgi:BirA family biotin operon repressor/biotin-[acetyl-CoA-carboxylase] ligase